LLRRLIRTIRPVDVKGSSRCNCGDEGKNGGGYRSFTSVTLWIVPIGLALIRLGLGLIWRKWSLCAHTCAEN
jgi:hypothetical protein